MNDYEGICVSSPEDVARHRDGRPSWQLRAAVRAPSKKAAREALGLSPTQFRHSFNETGDRETIAALDSHEPGTVLVHAMNPGGTVRDWECWIVRAVSGPGGNSDA